MWLPLSDELSNLARPIGMAFGKPKGPIRPSRDTTRAASRCWQRELADLACCGNASNFACPIELAFSKPESTIRSACDAVQEIMGQRELADLALRSDPSKLAGPIIGASFCEPDVPIWPCSDVEWEFFGRRQEELADLSHGGDAPNGAKLGEPKVSIWPRCPRDAQRDS